MLVYSFLGVKTEEFEDFFLYEETSRKTPDMRR